MFGFGNAGFGGNICGAAHAFPSHGNCGCNFGGVGIGAGIIVIAILILIALGVIF